MKVSVVVATYNRAWRLGSFLDRFKEVAEATTVDWELVIVDNNSRDSTRAVLERAASETGLPLIYRFEGQAGKSNALNNGIEAANGDIIAMTDDDCMVARDWVTSISEEFAEHQNLGGIGGRVELFDPNARPVATRTSLKRRRMKKAGQLFSFIIGANMAFRRSVLSEIGLFDPLFSPGAPIPAAEDVDVVYRAFLAGHHLEYVPTVLVHHDHGRVSQADVKDLKHGYVVGRGALYRKFVISRDHRMLGMALKDVFELGWQYLRYPVSSDKHVDAIRQIRHLREGWQLHSKAMTT